MVERGGQDEAVGEGGSALTGGVALDQYPSLASWIGGSFSSQTAFDFPRGRISLPFGFRQNDFSKELADLVLEGRSIETTLN